MKTENNLTRIKAPVLFKAEENVSWSSPRLYIKDGVKTIVMNRHFNKGQHTETVQVASSSRDLTYWTVPAVFEGGQPEGEEGKEAEPSQGWTQFPWSAAGIKAVSAVWDRDLEMYVAVYEGQEKTGKLSGSIGLAVSRDLIHWQSFLRDQPTYPGHGVIYEGDYYPAIPFGEYIHSMELPAGEDVFDVRDYGAVPDGETLSTEAVQAAVDAAAVCGGTVLVAGGYYCVGTVYVASGVTLWIQKDSALCASRDLKKYKDALIACVNAENVKITGGGKIVGRGEYFVYLPKNPPLTVPMETTKLPSFLYDPMGYPVDSIRYTYRSRIRYAEDRYAEGRLPIPRPMYTVWVRGCRNAVIENIIIEDALDWTLSIDCSDQVTVHNLVINGNRHVANTDGIDIMGSSQVEIDHCFVSCADDGICVKSPMKQGHDGITIEDADAEMRGTEQVHIKNCTVVSVMNAFKIGTETYFDIKDITVENCRFMLPDIYPGTVSGISIESADGSKIRNVQIRNIEMDRVCCPVFICLNMRNKYGFLNETDRQEKAFGGAIENIVMEHVRAYNAEVPSIITGFQTDENGVHTERRVTDIHIRDFKAIYHDNKEVLDIRTPVYENVRDYPENNAFGDVPAYGFYIRHADRVTLEDWEVIPRSMNTREALVREYTD